MALQIQKASNGVHAVVDADILLYRCSYIGQEYENASEAISAAAETVARVKDDLDVDNTHLTLVLSDSKNFRYKLYPEYKANRKDKEKPKYIEEVRSFLMDTYPSRVVDFLEADDVIAHYMKHDLMAVCCSIDKDMLQLVGTHYHLNKRIIHDIDETEADYFLARQCLTGDSTDNIPGFRGIGPKRADMFIEQFVQKDDNPSFFIEPYLNAAASYAHSIGDLQTFIDTYAMVKLQTELSAVELLVSTEDESLTYYRVPYDEL